MPDTPSYRAVAETIAARITDHAFKGRKGHGGGPCSARVLSPDELKILLTAAAELGATHVHSLLKSLKEE